jgi:hypothetical protein
MASTHETMQHESRAHNAERDVNLIAKMLSDVHDSAETMLQEVDRAGDCGFTSR